jgi:chromosome segregation ATPase
MSMSAETEEILQSIAAVELSILRRIERLEVTLGKRMDAMGVEVASLRALVKTLTDEKAAQHEAYRRLSVDLDKSVRKMHDHLDDLQSAQATLDHSIEVLEGRVRHLRNSVIPEPPTLPAG